MSVLIYHGQGVGITSAKMAFEGLHEVLSPFSLTVKTVDHHVLATTSWEDEALMIVFPGGRDAPYHRSLQGRANAKIAEFVSNGGAYLGLCAGAYYGSAAIEFEKGHPLEITAARELAFFPGKAIGPAFGLNCFSYESEKGARAAKIEWVGEEEFSHQEFYLYFNGGCYFATPENYSNTTVLGRYAELPGSPAAIIRCMVGQGQALLCGVHPEFHFSILDPLDPFSRTIRPLLEQEESKRRDFWRFLILNLLQFPLFLNR